MSGLSYCYNWDMLHHQQQLNNYQETEVPELLAPEVLHDFHDDFTLADTCIDPLFEPPPPPPPEANVHEFIVSSSSSSSSDNHQYYPHFLPQPAWPHDDRSICSQYNNNNNTKRPKHNYNNHDDQFYLYNSKRTHDDRRFLDGYVFPNSTSTTTPAVLPSFWPTYSSGSAAEEKDSKKSSNGGSCLSAQSVAARRRRKKITEKTEELGTLVPGARKMNTAEMFQAAFKYVKYLQAQVGMLELMGSIQNNEDPSHHQEDLQVLLESPIIQEKLYSEEKCLVPSQLVRNLAHDGEIQSNPSIMTGINQLLLQIDG